jgi:hypothetical protein
MKQIEGFFDETGAITDPYMKGYMEGLQEGHRKGWNDAVTACIEAFRIWFAGRMTSNLFIKQLESLLK